ALGQIPKNFFFFFTAEDGIRDFHVTGVQTCALPISARRPRVIFSSAVSQCASSTVNSGAEALRIEATPEAMCCCPHTISEKGMRSEERRVGKECRRAWRACQK